MSRKTCLVIAVVMVTFIMGVLWSYQKNQEVVVVSNETEAGANKIQDACYVGGCSSQICSDTPGVASNCEYREEYACYQKTSTCKRQSDGRCGWTQTDELRACIADSVSIRDK